MPMVLTLGEHSPPATAASAPCTADEEPALLTLEPTAFGGPQGRQSSNLRLEISELCDKEVSDLHPSNAGAGRRMRAVSEGMSSSAAEFQKSVMVLLREVITKIDALRDRVDRDQLEPQRSPVSTRSGGSAQRWSSNRRALQRRCPSAATSADGDSPRKHTSSPMLRSAVPEEIEVPVSPKRSTSSSTFRSFLSDQVIEVPASPKRALDGPGLEPRMSSYLGTDCNFEEKTEPATPKRSSTRQGSMSQLTSMMSELSEATHTQNYRTYYRKMLWSFMEDPDSSCTAFWYFHLFPIFIVLSVLGAILDAGVPVSDDGVDWQVIKQGLQVMQLVFEVTFALELLARFICSPSRRAFWRAWFNIIDMASVINFLVRLIVTHAFEDSKQVVLGLLVLAPVLRLLRLLRRFEKLHILISALQASAEALPVLLFTLLLIALSFAGLIYLAEPDNVDSLPKALWFTIVTMSTVGYGDISPSSVLGKLIVSVLIMISALYLAIPIGIVGTAFARVWEERGRLLLLQRLRECINRAGYTRDDIQLMFQVVDVNSSGDLDFDEFSRMLELMEIQVSKKWVIEVFESFDDDGAGSIDFNEFIRGLFPNSYDYMRKAREEQSGETPEISDIRL